MNTAMYMVLVCSGAEDCFSRELYLHGAIVRFESTAFPSVKLGFLLLNKKIWIEPDLPIGAMHDHLALRITFSSVTACDEDLEEGRRACGVASIITEEDSRFV